MCNDCDWEGAMVLCDDILGVHEENNFAASVMEWIEENQHVTDDQYRTLENLADSLGL